MNNYTKIFMVRSITLMVFGFSVNDKFKAAEINQTTEILATTLILEAGGERDARSLAAVYEVIRNRATAHTITLKSVIFKKSAFSCWNAGTIQNNLNKAKKHKKWAEALKITQNKIKSNYTFGADHYYATYIKKPKWAERMRQTTVIQHHIFCKN